MTDGRTRAQVRGTHDVMMDASQIRGIRRLLSAVLLPLAVSTPLQAQDPAGLAADALTHPDFTWIHRSAPGFRIHFLAGTYPASHQDSLIARVVAAKLHALSVLGAESFDQALDVLFVETRTQMEALIGARATGFADMEGRAVFLMTNPEWRAFERHEIMHVLARQLWGPPAEPSAWIQEGLAQFTDGRCAGYPNEQVLIALASDSGLTGLDTLVTRFRTLNDLTAYLQAASLVGYVYRTGGRDALRVLWSRGAAGARPSLPESLGELDAAWRRSLPARSASPTDEEVERIRQHGCG